MVKFQKISLYAVALGLPLSLATQNPPTVNWKTTTVQLPAPVVHSISNIFGYFYAEVEKNPVCIALPQKNNSLLIAWQSYQVSKRSPQKTDMSFASHAKEKTPQVRISAVAANGQFIKDIKKFPRARLAGFCQSATGAVLGLAYGDTLMVIGFDKQWKQTFERLVIGHVHPYTK